MQIWKEFPIDNRLTISSLYTVSKRRFLENYQFEGEFHAFYEIVYITEGKARIDVDGTEYKLHKGQLIIHSPDEFHTLNSDGIPFEVLIFSFNSSPLPISSPVFNLTDYESQQLNEIYEQAVGVIMIDDCQVIGINENQAAIASIVLKRLEIFLISLINDRSSNEKYNAKTYNYFRIVSAMQRRLCDATPPHIEDIATECNISISTISKTILRFTKHSAMEYYTILKMQRAYECLQHGMSIKETAYSIGYIDPNYFSKVFKKIIGYPPSQINKNNTSSNRP